MRCESCDGNGQVNRDGVITDCQSCDASGQLDIPALLPLKDLRELVTTRRKAGHTSVTLSLATVEDLIATREAMNQNRALRHVDKTQRRRIQAKRGTKQNE